MDRSVDNYLHKKFKKQLSIAEPKAQPLNQQNDKENHVSSRVSEPSPEKATHRDNNRIIVVPNQSTNSSSFAPLTGAPGLTSHSHNQSSISISESGNSKQCISNSSNLVKQHDDENRSRAVSFDTTTFRPIVTESRGSEATNINNHNNCNSPPLRSSTPPEYFINNLDSRMSSPPPNQEDKNEDALPTPEKNPNGKYVCHYCNLVCSKPSVLQKHIRAHTNERPYPCTSCGFSFKTRSNLYKHCRSRTHANRVMGVKAQESSSGDADAKQTYIDNATQTQLQYAGDEATDSSTTRNKPYKPRFHRVEQFDNPLIEDDGNKTFSGSDLSHHINEIINKNNSIVNSSDPNLLKRRLFNEVLVDSPNNNEYVQRGQQVYTSSPEEPLNLTNKNRKRCMSEATEPVMQKSLIKELLLKNLYSSDMQCPYCKMIFQTVTELECHKMRSCKGKPSEAKYTRSSSVNVASILTKNKNAFDSMPSFQNTVFPLNSPGPFLGKTRLVDGDKNKSFSFDNVNLPLPSPSETSPNYVLSSPTPFKEEKKPHVKLFGGEVKIHTSLGESKSYIIDSKDTIKSPAVENFEDFEGKMNENRVVKSGLQSGGTVLTSKTSKEEPRVFRDVIRVYENSSVSPNIDVVGLGKPQYNYELKDDGIKLSQQSCSINDPTKVEDPSLQKYPNIADFSQNAVKLLAPNLKHPGIQLSTIVPQSRLVYHPDLKLLSPRQPEYDKVASSPTPHISVDADREMPIKRIVIHRNSEEFSTPLDNNVCNPMNLLVNGKVIRYVPGMPGPVAAEGPVDMMFGSQIVAVGRSEKSTPSPLPINSPTTVCRTSPLIIQSPHHNLQSPSKREPPQTKSLHSDVKKTELKPPDTPTEPKKFARPNTLALKPTTASLKQHHGLTPTIFNQILISPDTPRVAKKYAQHLFNGNYFSYLGLKSSTKPVYCTLNKTQPFYVPHFKKLSMYSEWRQQDTKVDKLYVSAYDSRQKNPRFVTAGRTDADLIIHSSYKFVVSEVPSKTEKDEEIQKALVGGFECSEDSPYIRGRGRGRYVCEQCGIRCKKPSMLKKHIRTHSNDRPYTCSHCNFSFKTKGNLTKHMKSKSHTKNYTATSSGSSTALSISQSSESDTDDSGMDSSDESMTRQQEHEAAYGLLSLSQKTSGSPTEMLSSTGSALIRTASPTTPSVTEFMTTEEVAYVSKTNYAKNKILDDLQYKSKPVVSTSSMQLHYPTDEPKSKEDSVAAYLGKTSTSRPLTYPYTSPLVVESQKTDPAPKSIKEFHVIQKYVKELNEPSPTPTKQSEKLNYLPSPVPTLKVNDVIVQDPPPLVQERKRKINVMEEDSNKIKVHRNSDEVMDLSVTSSEKREPLLPYLLHDNQPASYPSPFENRAVEELNYRNRKYAQFEPANYQDVDMLSNSSSDVPKQMEYDNSAMETLADVATKQVRLVKNMMAKNVASEYLKLATQNENPDLNRDSGCFLPNKKHLNELIARSEGNKSCTICSKSFSKPSQLKLHMNIHYLERPFRCDSCSISFRCRGHLQKHEKSASHNSKLTSSPAQSSSEPRPFKCSDCNIAFRIQGHLAKHLRSKMHIMKLECLSKIPFGLYAELERSNSLLTEINTSDGDQCLESLKTLAKKVYINDPGKLQSLAHDMDPNSNASDPNS